MLWRAMLGPTRMAEDEQTLKERRLAYQELRAKMLDELHQEEQQQESNPSAPSKLRAMKQEVAPLVWPAGETFNQQATEAVTQWF